MIVYMTSNGGMAERPDPRRKHTVSGVTPVYARPGAVLSCKSANTDLVFPSHVPSSALSLTQILCLDVVPCVAPQIVVAHVLHDRVPWRDSYLVPRFAQPHKGCRRKNLLASAGLLILRSPTVLQPIAEPPRRVTQGVSLDLPFPQHHDVSHIMRPAKGKPSRLSRSVDQPDV